MNKFFILIGVLGAVLTSIFFLPAFKQVESALDTDVPEDLGPWITETYPPSQKELDILAGDTQFAKAKCGLRRFEEMSYIHGTAPMDVADLSVVLSGHDLANSIHRPERCMPAQGHEGLISSDSELALDNGRTIPLTRILSRQHLGVGEAEERRFITRKSITYYFFVGHDRITADHTERTVMDIIDRLAKGNAQRWAYVSATMAYTDKEDRDYRDLPSLEMADEKLRELLKELAEENIDWSRFS